MTKDVRSAMEAAKQQCVEQQLQSTSLSSIVQQYSSVKEAYQYEGYLTAVRNSRLRVHLGNFRLGNHKLQIQTARWIKDPILAQNHKTCRLCNIAEENEDHVLLHCPCYINVRTKVPDVCLNGSCKDLLANADQLRVAKYVAACLAARDNMLSQS